MDELTRWFTEMSLNLILGIATLAALWVALVQVRHARSESAAAKIAISRERRLTFELSLLSDIYEQWSMTDTAHLAGYINALITNQDDDRDIPLLRVATGAKSPYLDSSLLDQYPRDSVAFKIQTRSELDAAIQRRLEREG
ncbi:hypothetical protein GH740_03770 [Microbacterium sp. SYP-A9085]|uniref:hypothetical protein n=1 Tax=Microbacterium sp. SYP-A9085 TaxID=2664454 RepID=UPI00129B8E0D|nr:hypothetical protein [Microbacterium sp. SYP-A9085]MRH28430.1 hypothetical protein [Microbacterium sp. SYP-A9085]